MEENRFESESANALELLLECDVSENWQAVSTNEKDVILKNMNSNENNTITFKRSEGTINVSAKKLFDYIWDQKLEDKQKYENSLGEDKILQQINSHRHLRYQKYNLPWPIASRDTVVIRNKYTKKIGEQDW